MWTTAVVVYCNMKAENLCSEAIKSLTVNLGKIESHRALKNISKTAKKKIV